MIGELSDKLFGQFVVLSLNILVFSSGQDLCMASDAIANTRYKPSNIDRQRILNALMLYSTIRNIQSVFFREVSKMCRELDFGNDLSTSIHIELLNQEFWQDKSSPCENLNYRVKGFSEDETNLNFRLFSRF